MKVRFKNLHTASVSLPGPLPRLNVNDDITVDITPGNYDIYQEEIQDLIIRGFIYQEFVSIVGSLPNEYSLDRNLGTIDYKGTTIAPPTSGVIGPSGAISDNITSFDGPSGFVIKDSGQASVNVPSIDQKAALQGTSGTPSNSNKYVTNDDSRNTDARIPTGSAGGDLGSTYPNPNVVAVHESGGQRLPFGSINDGEVVVRQGNDLIGTVAVGPFEDNPPQNVDKSSASAGTSNTATRGDHKHDISTASAGTILKDQVRVATSKSEIEVIIDSR